jgi:hypothetical protein
MKIDVIIPLTGRTKSGKDAIAQIGVDKFGCTSALALSDWFKKILSSEFNIPLENFYNTLKDEPLIKPIVLDMGNLRRLKREWSGKAGLGAVTDRIAVSKWRGRQINSIRELMQWWAHEVVNGTVGPEFHCKVLEQDYLKNVKRDNDINVIFITDAREYSQSNYFVSKYPSVYPVKLVKSGEKELDHPGEHAVDKFPEGYFYETIENNGTLEDLELKVKTLLSNIMTDVKRRYEIHAPAKKGVKGEKKK